jgi:NaMN:DMB phosphoribosyltransferase
MLIVLIIIAAIITIAAALFALRLMKEPVTYSIANHELDTTGETDVLERIRKNKIT